MFCFFIMQFLSPIKCGIHSYPKLFREGGGKKQERKNLDELLLFPYIFYQRCKIKVYEDQNAELFLFGFLLSKFSKLKLFQTFSLDLYFLGKKAIDLARERNHKACVDILLAHQAKQNLPGKYHINQSFHQEVILPM